MAQAWHQIGIVYLQAGQVEPAERAYRQGLALSVQHRLRADEAASLGDLGNLYDAMGRLEEAVTFYRQAGQICRSLGDLAHEGMVCNNLADSLAKLGRYDEARTEILRDRVQAAFRL